MKLLTDLFTTDYGIMSISGIAFMLCMAGFFIWYFNHKMHEKPPEAPEVWPGRWTGKREKDGSALRKQQQKV